MYRIVNAIMIVLISWNLMVNPASGSDPVLSLTFKREYRLSLNLHNMMENGDVTKGPGGNLAALNKKVFPAIASQGITSVRFQMVPCGISLPHTHPRATEILTLSQGGPLQVGFVDTNGDVTIFPRGLLHFELNVGPDTAHYISALNSENPGTLTAVGALFKLPAWALASTFNITVEDISGLNS